ncbi:MAG: excinuclease ABC subunit UvrC [Candidatus Kerfeldbacteria bacterium]
MKIIKPKSIQNIPLKPGVYIYKDGKKNILYIGKAKKLKNRVSSYFHNQASLTPDKEIMVSKIKKIEYFITSSETEALLLETSLIKKNQPPYNIDLKDDKYFLYIKITTSEDYPRVFTVRRIEKDKEKYFGPFTSALSVRETLRLLRKLFPHRNFTKPKSQHQLKFLLKRYAELLGPLDKKEYQQSINKIIQFLKGDYSQILKDLKTKMEVSAKNKKFEKAAGLRDKIYAIQKISEKQKVVSIKLVNEDIISISHESTISSINLFNIRQGKLINKENFILENTHGQNEKDILQAFIEQYYSSSPTKPNNIIVPIQPANKSIIEKTFSFKVIVPQKGVKKQYIKLGEENAKNYLEQQKATWQREDEISKESLSEIKKLLKLKNNPKRIEIYDISNIQGISAVGSMVVFTNGQPDKKWYRKFKIKTIDQANDPAMMAEVLSRRFQHIDKKNKTWPKPDLIILDGGKGQLNTVNKAIEINIPIIALAKKNEDIYQLNKKNPVNLTYNSPAFFLIQRMRDEAHRFAITFFRKSHQKSSFTSQLDGIPGIGPNTKKKLIKHFGSSQNVLNATQVKISKIIGEKKATNIKSYGS